ncbi:MAG: hypothetical protein IJ438_08665 [Clostridia bacterium]|nr:hypothetical protein [Clostridia bacterium]
MKKVMTWAAVIASIAALLSWGVMGVKIFDGDYETAVEAHIMLVSILILLVCAVYKLINSKCPHCGKLRLTSGKYCSHCGKEIE